MFRLENLKHSYLKQNSRKLNLLTFFNIMYFELSTIMENADPLNETLFIFIALNETLLFVEIFNFYPKF